MIIIFSALLALLATPYAGAPQKAPTIEYQVKASYLYNFIQFVEWPPDAFSGSIIFVCVLGEDRFGPALEAIDGEIVRGRTIAVRHIGESEEPANCQVLFVSASERDREPLILGRLAGQPVLTVGETAGFTESGGVINLLLVTDKVRFEINRAAAMRNRLKLSAQLLQLGMNR